MGTWTVFLAGGATIVVDDSDYAAIQAATQPGLAPQDLTVQPASGFPMTIHSSDVVATEEAT